MDLKVFFTIFATVFIEGLGDKTLLFAVLIVASAIGVMAGSQLSE